MQSYHTIFRLIQAKSRTRLIAIRTQGSSPRSGALKQVRQPRWDRWGHSVGVRCKESGAALKTRLVGIQVVACKCGRWSLPPLIILGGAFFEAGYPGEPNMGPATKLPIGNACSAAPENFRTNNCRRHRVFSTCPPSCPRIYLRLKSFSRD